MAAKITIVLLSVNVLAAWPQWLWLADRANDGSDEPWGIVAIVTLCVLLWERKTRLQRPTRLSLAISASLMLMANDSWQVWPPLLATALALLAVVALIIGLLPKPRPVLPLLILALLALPLAASLNFYLGYPLRWLCAQATAGILSGLGLAVTPLGAGLQWQGVSVLIDAPCAGIAMLWLGWYLAVLLSYRHLDSNRRCLVQLGLATVSVVLINILRNTLLFFKEAGIVPLPEWTHQGIGLFLFALLVLLVVGSRRLFNATGVEHEHA